MATAANTANNVAGNIGSTWFNRQENRLVDRHLFCVDALPRRFIIIYVHSGNLPHVLRAHRKRIKF